MFGETVQIEFSSADATTAAAVTLKDSDGGTRVLAANERLLIDTVSAALAAAVTLCELFADYDADGNVDAGERIAAFTATGPAFFDGGEEGYSIRTGFTPKVKATVAGSVIVNGSGRIVARGVDGRTRPAYKETKPGSFFPEGL